MKVGGPGRLSRRALLGGAASVLMTRQPVPAASTFGWPDVRRRAEIMAQQPYRGPGAPLPDWARGWGYEEYREIEFDPARALWHSEGLRFEIDFFPRGASFGVPVMIHVVEPQRITPLLFDPSLFRRWPGRAPRPPSDGLGFAGLRVRYPLIAGPPSHQECVVFLGASYFRGVGRGQVYGVSARGVAIDTATDRPEEFPAFREFWLVRPAPEAEDVRILGLLEGPSLTGAYEFQIGPGDDTVLGVTAEVFARRTIKKLGLCPLSSMHLFGEFARNGFDDFRPEVHDSDGLLLQTSRAEWLWRPLDNASRLRVSRFRDSGTPGGFGLLQRDRVFDHYQDLEALYHRRPNAWIEPRSPWPGGSVELLEFPSRQEYRDNVAAFWACDAPLAGGSSLRWAYELRFGGRGTDPTPQARVVGTRSGAGSHSGSRRFVVDFEGPALRSRSAEQVVGDVTPVTASAPIVEATPGGLRVVFEVTRPRIPVELRCFLRAGTDALSETWSYLLQPR
jgi:glucans biosynthesis protein